MPGRCAALMAACALLAACSPRFDWREVRPAEQRYVVAMPDKPQTAQREVELPGARVPMTMTSTGVGATLFAVGVAQLPAPLAEPVNVAATVALFRDGLLRNVGAAAPQLKPATLATPAGRSLRHGEALTAAGRVDANGRKTVLAARFFVIDDRLYQVVALGSDGELAPAVLDTFFDSFRLTD
jgi:hypothetical protein